MLEFDREYNREEWLNFFENNKFTYRDTNDTLFELFIDYDNRDDIKSKYESFIDTDRCFYLGDLETYDNDSISVYEIVVRNTKENSKIKLFRFAVDVLLGWDRGRTRDGIFFFLYLDEKGRIKNYYRLSYVHYSNIVRGGKVVKDYTNPKRYSFLLGVGIPNKTARDRLKPEAFNSVSSILEAFSVDAVNREFYLGVKKHFELINADVSKDFKNDDFLIKNFSLRFLGRILFCWFLKEKDFIDKALFDVSLSKNYYKNVLYDLFFNVLNGKMGERKINSDIVKEYENNIPFLNGGLFSVRDDEKDIYSIKDSTLKSLFEFFNMYNFTVDESSAFDEEVSIDPEMLGRIFENLLAEINPETKESARKETGSFYTPREIVDYMITSSIILYLKNVTEIDASKLDKLFLIGSEALFDTYERKEIIKAIHKIKILDPACGSGAFPIGVLQRIFYLIDKLDSEHNIYKEEILSSITNTSIRDKMKDLFANDKLNYAYKLDILKSSIYGVDIQAIAIEISRLRAFLALIVDEKKIDSETNFGIQPLPNLEFQFICANSLKSIYFNLEDGSIEKHFVDSIIDKMNKISKMFFSASSSEEKENVKHRFLEFRELVQNCDYISDDIKEEILSWNPFENKTANFFSPIIQLGIDGGFDIVIGNPPYIQLQGMLKAQKELYQSVGFKTFTSMGDIYQLFYENNFTLLSDIGVVALITSNKWMRAGYGKTTREYFYKNADIYGLLDLGSGRFNSATVDTNIIFYGKSKQKKVKDKRIFIAEKFFDDLSNLQYLTELKNNIVAHNDKEWVIMNKIENEIFEKIKNYKTIKELDIEIYRGITTGFNEAFVIDEETKNKLIKEDKKSKEVIKPLLRGRDIKRYSYDYSKLYFINTHNGIREKSIPPIDIKKYPAVKKHLDKYYKQLEKRQDKGITPYNLRNCTYIEEFEKDKIIYQEISKEASYCFDNNNYFISNNAYIMISNSYNLKLLLGLLNSKLYWWIFKKNNVVLGSSAIRMLAMNIENLPIPEPDAKTKKKIIRLVEEVIALKKDGADSTALERQIDEIVYSLYGLTDEEIKIVENS